MLICEAVAPDGKTCRGCKQYKAMSDFSTDKAAKYGLRIYCRPCDVARAAARRNANPERTVLERRRHRLQHYYGMSMEEHDTMLASQGGCCALCRAPTSGTTNGGFRVDHDHETGAVRALLCNACNVGLGQFRDNPELMRLAATYVENHRAKVA